MSLARFEPTPKKGEPRSRGDAIANWQGKTNRQVPTLRMQVQNFVTHGMAGPQAVRVSWTAFVFFVTANLDMGLLYVILVNDLALL